MRAVQHHRITVLPGPPTIYQTLLDHPKRGDYDLTSLRFAVTGAAVVPVVLIERMQSELDIDIVLTAYGLTEANGFGTMCTADDDAVTVATTCGRPIADFELRIDDPPRRDRRSAAARAERDAGLPRRPGSHRGRDRRRRLAAHRRRRNARRRRQSAASPTGSRTCTSAADSTSTPPRSSRCWPGSTVSPSPRSSACPTSGSAKSARRSS